MRRSPCHTVAASFAKNTSDRQLEIRWRQGRGNSQPGIPAKPIGISLFLAVLQFLSRMKDLAHYHPYRLGSIVLNPLALGERPLPQNESPIDGARVDSAVISLFP